MGRARALTNRDQGIPHLSKAIDLNPSLVAARMERARILLCRYEEKRHASTEETPETRKELEAILEDLAVVRKVSKSNRDLLCAEGLLSFSGGKFAEAADKLVEYLAEVPTDGLGHYFQGRAYANLGNWREAEASYARAIQYNSHDVNAFYGRGYARARLRMFDEALSDYQKALELRPKSPHTLLAIAGVHEERKDYPEAIRGYTAALSANPSDVLARCQRAALHVELGHLEEAEKDLTEAIFIQGDYVRAYHDLGTVLFRKKDYEGAIRNFSEALKLDPEAIPTTMNRADAAYFAGRYAETFKDIQTLLQQGIPLDDHFRTLLEECRQKLGLSSGDEDL
jgi:tetratricopeptide (TPR) repeat protein